MKKKKKKNRITDEALYDMTYEVIKQAGWIMPTDEKAVAEAEARLEKESSELPENLKVPKFPSSAAKPTVGKVVPLWDPTALFSPMARAAREGGKVSPKVEEMMRRDREIAEREMHAGDAMNNDGDDPGPVD